MNFPRGLVGSCERRIARAALKRAGSTRRLSGGRTSSPFTWCQPRSRVLRLCVPTSSSPRPSFDRYSTYRAGHRSPVSSPSPSSASSGSGVLLAAIAAAGGEPRWLRSAGGVDLRLAGSGPPCARSRCSRWSDLAENGSAPARSPSILPGRSTCNSRGGCADLGRAAFALPTRGLAPLRDRRAHHRLRLLRDPGPRIR